MSIDPNIALSVQPVAFNDPFAVLEKYRAGAQERQLRQQQIQTGQALEESRRQDIAKQANAEADQRKFYDVLATSTSPDEAAEKIRVTVPSLYQPFLKQRAELDEKAAALTKSTAEAEKIKGEIQKQSMEYSEPFLQLVEKSGYNPGVFDFALNTIAAHHSAFPAEQLRQQAAGDPAKIKQIIDGFKSPQQQTADTGASRLALDKPTLEANAKIQTAVANNLSPQGLTPGQQQQGAQADRQAQLAAQRLALEQRRLNKPDNDTGRMDRSYTQANSSLESIRKPLADQMERFGRLAETVNQSTPQADALIAPELLTVMAGGAGSGLRMNEAEISRIIGGRSNFEGLKAAVNKWQLDPSKALSVTPAQRQQIRDLMGAVQKRTDAKLSLVNQASQALIDAPDVDTQRRIIADTRKKLDEVGSAAPSKGGIKILSIEEEK